MDDFSGKLFSTAAVLTETMHFVADAPGGARALAELVRRSGMIIPDVSQPGDLDMAVQLMEDYADTPMDFADATLVVLSDLLEVQDILTLDRRGFSTYRTLEGRSFRLILDLL